MDAQKKRQLRDALVAARARKALAEAVSVPDLANTWVATVGGADIELPASVLPTLIDLLADVAEGREVTVAPADIQLGTTEASRLLGVSRTWLVELIDRDDLPAEVVGTKRRVPLGAVVARRRRQSERLRAAAADLGDSLDEAEASPAEPARPDRGAVKVGRGSASGVSSAEPVAVPNGRRR